MATSRFLTFSFFLALIFTNVVFRSDSIDSSSSPTIEVGQPLHRIIPLDSGAQQQKSKDEIIADKEKIIQEMSNSIILLQNEAAFLQQKRTQDADEQLTKAYAWTAELEKQVDMLKKELQTKNWEKQALEVQTNESQKKMHELNFELLSLQKIADEQKSKIHKTERAFKAAEEEMVKAKLESMSKTKKLMEIHDAWLPPWLAAHLARYETFVRATWDKHGKPTADIMMQMALERKARAAKWVEPHVQMITTKWIPVVGEQFLVITTYIKPHVQSMTTKTVEVYKASKSAVTPHYVKVQEFVHPYFQEVEGFSKPYVDRVATLTKSHVDKVRHALKPYTDKVKGTVEEMLKKHELTRHLATKEFVTLATSAFLALPFIILSRTCSGIFWNKLKQPIRDDNSIHARRKAKRPHPDE